MGCFHLKIPQKSDQVELGCWRDLGAPSARRETRSDEDKHMGAIAILIVDSDEADREALRRVLIEADILHKVLTAKSGKDAGERLHSGYFDCVFVSAKLDDGAGIDLVPAINRHRDRPGAATIVTGSGDDREIVAAMRGGAVDYLSKANLRPDLVRQAIEAGMRAAQHQHDLRDMRGRLNHLAMFDARTGLPTRTLFCDRLNHAVLTARRNRQNLAVMVMNLDFFKEVNDRFGRAAGDAALVEIGSRIRNVMRGSDTLARLRGDEFATLLPGVDSRDAAIVVAQKISVATGAPLAIDKKQVTIGISIGIAMFPDHGQGPEALFDNADAAMRRAKLGTRGYAFHAVRGAGQGAMPDRRAHMSDHLAGEQR
jgi:diguanylate cyclase (GGDEF)-like protein